MKFFKLNFKCNHIFHLCYYFEDYIILILQLVSYYDSKCGCQVLYIVFNDWMILNGRCINIVGGGSAFSYDSSWYPKQNHILTSWLWLGPFSPMEENIFPMDWRYYSIYQLFIGSPPTDRIMVRTCSSKIWRKGMGLSMPWRLGVMCIQLKILSHCCQAVVYFWKNVEFNPWEINFCVALYSDSVCTLIEGGADAKDFSVVNYYKSLEEEPVWKKIIIDASLGHLVVLHGDAPNGGVDVVTPVHLCQFF